MLSIDHAPTRWTPPSNVIHERSADQQIIGLADGWGDWGRGIESSHAFCRRLQTHPLLPVASPSALAAALAQHALLTPVDPDPEFAASFSLGLLLVKGATATILQSGALDIVHVRFSRVLAHVRSRRWVDDQVAQGHMSQVQAERHPLRDVFRGPYLGSEAAPPNIEGPWQLAPGDRFLIAPAELVRSLDPRDLSGSALALQTHGVSALDTTLPVLIASQSVA